ncbi:MAG: hypothetical protein CM15mP74_19050 [Halieaceae bacterium]|nr:MAG: hypothetical protein CM15mP74_19050 [Halieaceae bacterium]
MSQRTEDIEHRHGFEARPEQSQQIGAMSVSARGLMRGAVSLIG